MKFTFLVFIIILFQSCYSNIYDFSSNKIVLKIENNSHLKISEIFIDYNGTEYAFIDKFQYSTVIILPYNGESLKTKIYFDDKNRNMLEKDIYVYGMYHNTNQLVVKENLEIKINHAKNDIGKINKYKKLINGRKMPVVIKHQP